MIKMVRNILVFFLCFLLPDIVNGQVFTALYDSTLQHFNDTLFTTLSPRNIVFRGIDNSFILRNSLFPFGIDSIKGNGKPLDKAGDSVFFHDENPNFQEILLVRMWPCRSDTSLSKEFVISSLPKASVYFGHTNLTHTHVLYKRDVLSADSVYILYGNEISESGNWLKVEHYSIGYSYGNYYINRENGGNKVENRIRHLLLSIPPGQEVTLRLLVQGMGDIEREISDLRFRVY